MPLPCALVPSEGCPQEEDHKRAKLSLEGLLHTLGIWCDQPVLIAEGSARPCCRVIGGAKIVEFGEEPIRQFCRRLRCEKRFDRFRVPGSPWRDTAARDHDPSSDGSGADLCPALCPITRTSVPEKPSGIGKARLNGPLHPRWYCRGRRPRRISIRQLKAARALLAWSQERLAAGRRIRTGRHRRSGRCRHPASAGWRQL